MEEAHNEHFRPGDHERKKSPHLSYPHLLVSREEAITSTVNIDGAMDSGARDGNRFSACGCVPVAGCDAVISR